MLADSNCTSWAEDLTMCVTVESLCYMLGTSIKLFTNYTSISKKGKKTSNNQLEYGEKLFDNIYPNVENITN